MDVITNIREKHNFCYFFANSINVKNVVYKKTIRPYAGWFLST
jgi:hypothetical protein